jgi:hypothetical protein
MDIVLALAICSTVLGALALQAVVSIVNAATRRGQGT